VLPARYQAGWSALDAASHYCRAMADEIELLSRIPLFQGVSKKDIRLLAKVATDMTYEAGTRMSTQHELGVTFFVVVEGEADVAVNGQVVNHLKDGDFFGEMSIIDRSPRSADVVATTSLRALVFTRWVFRPFLKDHPDVAWAMLEELVRRIRQLEAAPD
jgi:CRP-like cAMP-binding protein